MLPGPAGAGSGEICLAALPYMGCALPLTLPTAIFAGLAIRLRWLGG